MICPLHKIGEEGLLPMCFKEQCAWWDNANNCCCVKSIVIELIKTGEQQ